MLAEITGPTRFNQCLRRSLRKTSSQWAAASYVEAAGFLKPISLTSIWGFGELMGEDAAQGRNVL